MAVRYACFLLNQNIGQLLVWLGHTKIDCRETLANLLLLMNTPVAFRRRTGDEQLLAGEEQLLHVGAGAAPLMVLTDKLSRLMLMQENNSLPAAAIGETEDMSANVIDADIDGQEANGRVDERNGN